MSTDRRPSFYDPRFEHDACGVGFVAQVSGTPSHRIVQLGIQSVVNLTHRGAIDADGKSGDGAGILSQIPRKIVQRELARLGLGGSDPRDVAVGMFFLPRDAAANERARGISAEVFQRHGLRLLGWRPVPVDPDALGDKARATQPDIVQPLLARPAGQDDQAFERTLYLARKEIEAAATREALKDLYIPSLSQRTVVYKGLFVAPQLAAFYRDLADPDFESALVVFHQRYSTNTFPTWQLAQPFRALAHNGEINTLWGNRNWMRAREPELSSPLWGERIAALKPIVREDGSDSASLDHALELLTLSGRDLCHAMMMLVPEAWENMPDMDADWRAFYMYHACLTEPWDGPAALAFTDGLVAAACLDRNGLRPARYKVTEDGLVIVASEVGTVDLPDQRVVEKGRLGPGEMIAVDTARGRLLRNDDLKALYAQRQPYCAWVTRHLVALDGHSSAGQPNGHASQDPRALTRLQQTFGYTNEDLKFVIEPMAATAKDAVWSMGDDAPPAVLSLKPKLLYSYFKQRFAQVTNPPIDPLREQLVMALDTYLGRRGSLLEETPAHGHLVQLRSPILTDAQLDALRSLSDPAFRARTLSALFPVAEGTAGLDAALERLCAAARAAIADGVSVLVVSDRGVTTDRAPLPLLLAVGALHHDLTRRGLRMRADIVVEGGEVWEVHHFATLIGYGASAVNPYLAHATARALASEQQHEPLDPDEAVERYNRAVEQALLKIMSKMGISTVTSYRGAQIFEAIGLDDDLVARHFTGTPSRINGIGLEAIAREALERHAAAYELPLDGKAKLPDFGFYRYRRDGEYHGFSPQVVRALQKAADSGSRDLYRAYVELLYSRKPAALRDLLRFRKVHLPVPLEEIEPAEVIVRRFNSQAMSLGALSPEAHKTIAIAMNRLGCRSNTGEGGEDPAWFHPLDTGDSANSKIKQVASGRFGVTPEYLARA
ncbi:MAG: glutamate synthase subunit alpha, partial [Chloroflexi bacterium]|nr:glutamate synthase subunit alpha [Chloroflexota bacterium]